MKKATSGDVVAVRAAAGEVLLIKAPPTSQPASSGARQVDTLLEKLGNGGCLPLSFGTTPKAESPHIIRPLPAQDADSAQASMLEAERELVRALEKLERLKAAAALAAAEAERVPSILLCPSCANPVSSTTNFCCSCGAPVKAAGNTPRLPTDRSSASPGVTNTGGNTVTAQQQLHTTTSATNHSTWTGGGNALGPAPVVATLRGALGGSSSTVSLAPPVRPGDLPVLPRTRRVGHSRPNGAKVRRTLRRADFAM